MGNAVARSQPEISYDPGSQYRTFLIEYSYSNLNIVFNASLPIANLSKPFDVNVTTEW